MKPTRCATAWRSSTMAESSRRARRSELKGSIPGGYLLRAALRKIMCPRAARLKGLPGVTEVRVTDKRHGCLRRPRRSADPPHREFARRSSAELHDVHIAEPSLETLFLHHTGRSLRE